MNKEGILINGRFLTNKNWIVNVIVTLEMQTCFWYEMWNVMYLYALCNKVTTTAF